MDVAAEVGRFLQRYSTLKRIGVAVSGGADSVVLLRTLVLLGGSELAILHVNHGLRGEDSDGDEVFVQELAQELDLPFHGIRADRRSGNLEDNARRARQEHFRKVKTLSDLDGIALGHTLTDQAETVLFRFLRGSGTAGVSGMAARTRSGLVRPLLNVTRQQVRAFGLAQGWQWREDSSNQDLRFRRNRLRIETIPMLAQQFNPQLERILAKHATLAQDEERYWARQISKLVEKTAQFWSDGTTTVHAERFRRYPVAIQRRLLRALIRETKGDLKGINATHIDAARLRFTGPLGHDRVQLPGIEVLRSFQLVLLARPEYLRRERDYRVPVVFSAVYTLPHNAGRFSVNPVTSKGGFCGTVKTENDDFYEEADLDLRLLGQALQGGNLTVRNWQPGDSLEVEPAQGKVKLKSLFQQDRVPLWERRHWPVLVAGREVIWARKFGVDRAFSAKPVTEERVRVSYRPVKRIRDAIESKIN